MYLYVCAHVCVFEGEGGGSVDGDEHLGIVPLIFMVKC
jgi:hypothetical protein